jgi:hypothetical protein
MEDKEIERRNKEEDEQEIHMNILSILKSTETQEKIFKNLISSYYNLTNLASVW